MPFAKSAKITVTNEGRQPVQAFFWYVDWQKLPEVGPDVAYFHAMYRQEFPTVSGRNYLLADIEGKGHYVGTVLNVRQLSPSWYGEGDDFFFIDGEDTPRLRDHVLVENRHEPTRVHLRTYIDQRYKITIYRNADYGELFDLEEDPEEHTNLWANPEHAVLKSQLLHRFMQAELQREPTRMPRIWGA